MGPQDVVLDIRGLGKPLATYAATKLFVADVLVPEMLNHSGAVSCFAHKIAAWTVQDLAGRHIVSFLDMKN